MVGINQVIIASMIGAGGLGHDMLTSLKRLRIGDGGRPGPRSRCSPSLSIASPRLSRTVRPGRTGTRLHPSCDARIASYAAMKCASALREAMWSMASEIHSEIDFDYLAYTEENLERFERAWEVVGR